MIKNTTSSRLAILHEIEKYLTDAESDKATACCILFCASIDAIAIDVPPPIAPLVVVSVNPLILDAV